MGGFSLWHILIFAIILLLLFGGNRFSAMMGDVAKGLKSFKQGMGDDEEDARRKHDEQRRADDLVVGVDGVELGIGQRTDEQLVQLRCGVVEGRGDPELQPGIRCPVAGRLVVGRHHRRVSAIDASGGAGPLIGCSVHEGIDESERVTQSRERVAGKITVTSDRMPDCGICELQQDSAATARDEGSLRADVGEAAGGRRHKPTVRGVAVPHREPASAV